MGEHGWAWSPASRAAQLLPGEYPSLALGGSRTRWLSGLHPKVNAGPFFLSAQALPAFLAGSSPVSRSQVSKCQQAAVLVGHRESGQLQRGAVSADPSAANCCPSNAPTCF